jgi:hypothetical protein
MENKFSKEQIAISKQFTPIEKDILNALLGVGDYYSIEDAKKIINNFYNKEVK